MMRPNFFSRRVWILILMAIVLRRNWRKSTLKRHIIWTNQEINLRSKEE